MGGVSTRTRGTLNKPYTNVFFVGASGIELGTKANPSRLALHRFGTARRLDGASRQICAQFLLSSTAMQGIPNFGWKVEVAYQTPLSLGGTVSMDRCSLAAMATQPEGEKSGGVSDCQCCPIGATCAHVSWEVQVGG